MGNFTDMFVQQNEREWVFFVLFCFYSTFKLIDFIKKNSRSPISLEKSTNTRSEFPRDKSCQDLNSGCYCSEGT